MDPQLFNDIQNFLAERLRQANTREAVLDAALHGCGVLKRIDVAGNPADFTAHLIMELLTWGDCTDSEPSLVTLLRYVGENLGGPEVKAKAEALIRRLITGSGAELAAGQVVCGCTLIERKGGGGNGSVWLAHQPGTERKVAIKLMHPRLAADPKRVQRFREEPRVQARLEAHPNITTVYSVCEHEGLPAIVMQYVPGGSLEDYLEARGAVDHETACDWLGQIASALDEAHQLQPDPLYHRDVKPENILVRYGADGHPEQLFLTDFGLALSADPDKPRQTVEGEKVGTREYIAPEQFAETYYHHGISGATDVYALGIMAYELLTGVLPFTGEDHRILLAHEEDELPEHPALRAEVLAVLRKACAKVPSERYPTAGEFVRALREWELDEARLRETVETYFKEKLTPFVKRLKKDLGDALVAERSTLDDQAPPETSDEDLPMTAPVPMVNVLARPGDDVLFDDDDDDADDLLAAFLGEELADAYTETGATYQRHDNAQPEPVGSVRDYLLNYKRGVLLGKPGAGKSWTLQMVMFDYWRRWREQPDSTRIPVFVPLNTYNGDQSFEDFIKAQMGVLAPDYEQLKGAQRLMLLCDALNEMPGQPATLETLRKHLQDAPHFVVSCRVLDYQRKLNGLDKLEALTLNDLDLADIQRFYRKYLGDAVGSRLWTVAGGSPDLIAARDEMGAERFWSRPSRWDDNVAHRAMFDGAALIPLSRNPFMASLVCRVYKLRKGTLPKGRGDLFETIIDAALTDESTRAARRGDAFPEVDAVKDWLRALAVAMQAREGTVLTTDEVPNFDEALSDAARRASLLDVSESDGETRLRFAHQLFQEYFAASELLTLFEANVDPSHLIGEPWWQPNVWWRTAVILGELPGKGRGPNAVAAWLAPYSPELAKFVLLENAEYQAGQIGIETGKQSLFEAVENIWSKRKPTERAAAYRVLGHPDIDVDDREGVGLRPDGLPDIVWRPVPAGEYPIGGDGEAYQPLDRQTYTVPEGVQIALYPVTYRQFEAFRQSPAFEDTNNACWADMPEDQRGPKAIGEQRYQYHNHPRERVSWYGAAAFCRWLTEQYRAEGIISANEAVMLPDERLWEAAARGKDSKFYPFGGYKHDARVANVADTGIDMTSAVGIFPEGAADCGALDMSGNVWEWCASKFDAPDNTSIDDSNSRRVLRGASFSSSDTDVLRAAARLDLNPNYHDGYGGGFRVVLVPIS